MKSMIQNALSIHKAIKSVVKTSFININLKTKWYNHKDNLSIDVSIGCVRSSKKPTSFTDEEYEKLISNIELSIGSYQIKKKDRKTLTDNKSKQPFEVVTINLIPIDI